MIDFSKKILNSDKFPLSEHANVPRGIHGIYKIENKSNGNIYIGQSVDIRHRLFNHILKFKNKNKKCRLHAALIKYGIENFDVSIICILNIENRSKESIKKELNIIECMYIDIFDSFSNGYNATQGGDSGRLGYKHTESTIAKMKASAKGRAPIQAVLSMKKVFGRDIINNIDYIADSISEMGRKTNVHSRNIGYICNNYKGRFIADKRFIFSFSKGDLENRFNYIISGARDIDLFNKRSSVGKKRKKND